MSNTDRCTTIGGKTAAKFDQDKLRYDLIPPEADLGLANVLTYGAEKYEERNWEKGTDFMRIVGAIKRHLAAFEMGQDIDPKTGLLHVDQIATNAAFLQTFLRRGIGTDNRVQHYKDHPFDGDLVANFIKFVNGEDTKHGGNRSKSKSDARKG